MLTHAFDLAGDHRAAFSIVLVGNQIADSGCSASEQDGHGVVSHISLFWVPVPGECERYRMILAAGLMLTLSTTKGGQEQQGESVACAAGGRLSGGAGAGRDRRRRWWWWW
jgi:hypothetical protein